MKLYVIYDSKSETYTNPTVNPSRGQALRSFSDAINRGDSVLADHPQDFTLFEIGEWSNETGEGQFYDKKTSVANGLDVKIDDGQEDLLKKTA